MHRPINLVKLLRGTQNSTEQKKATFFVTYEALLSNRDSELKYKEGEVASLVAFACGCLSHGVPESCLDGFAFSYPIPHVPKEMDLLKVGENCVLDIELKSRKVGEEKVKKQLTSNRYYLSFLGRSITCLCYTSEDDSWLRLVDEEVLPAIWDDAVQFLYEAADFDSSLDFLPVYPVSFSGFGNDGFAPQYAAEIAMLRELSSELSGGSEYVAHRVRIEEMIDALERDKKRERWESFHGRR